MQNTIFITGASSGIGRATAKLFHSKGWNVIATMRTPEQETELSQLENMTLLPLDVTDLEQIRKTVSLALSEHGVDVVFNNAGYGLLGSLEAYTDEQIVQQINTNLLGVIRVTKEFIPHFRKKKSGLFISTTSMGGFMGFPLHSIYHATKFGIEGWSESMSFELGLYQIGIKTIAPGATLTSFLERSLEKGLHPAYQDLEGKLLGSTDAMMSNSIAPKQVAAVVYQAATDGKDQIRYLVGEDTKAMDANRLKMGREDFRKELRKQFL